MITPRLELIPATVDLCEAETRGPDAVGRALRVRVPTSWPPPVFELDDVERVWRQLAQDPTSHAWTLYYLVLQPATVGGERDLVGIAGYLGPPSDGTVEIGYAIAREHQRRGYGTEAVQALVTWALQQTEVVAVAATTYVSLEPSIGVLRNAGFTLVSQAPDTGLLRYVHRRDPGPVQSTLPPNPRMEPTRASELRPNDRHPPMAGGGT
jgi:ribosomal-protein-alanine N-acetyltransferase